MSPSESPRLAVSISSISPKPPVTELLMEWLSVSPVPSADEMFRVLSISPTTMSAGLRGSARYITQADLENYTVEDRERPDS